MNYILHLNNILEEFAHDQRLTPHHISLYLALFRAWNYNRFNNPIYIFRNELIVASKIGSYNTYTKCLKELDKWNYLSYEPSFNPQKGSRVYLYSFDKGASKGGDKGTDKAGVKVVRPIINNTNSNKHIKTNGLNISLKKNYDEPL